jgi:hypothetical protein
MATKENKNISNKKPSMAERYPRTISINLFRQWKKMRRFNDGRDLTIHLAKSRPIIDRALKYGHVKDETLIKKITKFFADRERRESELDAKSVEQLSKSVTNE